MRGDDGFWGPETFFSRSEHISVPRVSYKDKKNESYEEKNLIKITWNRLGPTHLRPKLTIYDHNRKRMKGYLLRRKKHFSFQYLLPEGSGAFFLKISDEIGFLEGVAGSYQSFRYILTVH